MSFEKPKDKKEKGSKNYSKKGEKIIMIHNKAIPSFDLEIIKKIASFFGKENEEDAKKILIERYFQDKSGKGFLKFERGGGSISLIRFFNQQKELYGRRIKENTTPTLSTLIVSLRNYFYETPQYSGRRKGVPPNEYDQV